MNEDWAIEEIIKLKQGGEGYIPHAYKHIAGGDDEIQQPVKSAAKLATARTIGISGGATGTATSFDGSANVTIPVTSLDATKLSGNINASQLSGSVPAASLPVATTTTKGEVIVGSGLSVDNTGKISVTSTPFPMLARLYTTDQGYGTLIKNNTYNGITGQSPLGIELQNPAEMRVVDYSVSALYQTVHDDDAYARGHAVVSAVNVLTGTKRELLETFPHTEYGPGIHVDYHFEGYCTISVVEVLVGKIVQEAAYMTSSVTGGYTSSGYNTTYIGAPT